MSVEPDDPLAAHAWALDAHYPREEARFLGASSSVPGFAWEAILIELLISSVLPLLLGGLLAFFRRLRARRRVRAIVEAELWDAHAFGAGEVAPTADAATDAVMGWSRGLTIQDVRGLELAYEARVRAGNKGEG